MKELKGNLDIRQKEREKEAMEKREVLAEIERQRVLVTQQSQLSDLTIERLAKEKEANDLNALRK